MTASFAEALEARTQDVLDSLHALRRLLRSVSDDGAGRHRRPQSHGNRRRACSASSRAKTAPPKPSAGRRCARAAAAASRRCPEGVNPRFMLALARVAMQRARERRGAARERQRRVREDGPRRARALAHAAPARGAQALPQRPREGRAAGGRLLHRLQRAQDAAHRAALPRHPRRARRVVPRDGRARRLLRRAPVPHRRSRRLGPHRLPHDRPLRGDRRVARCWRGVRRARSSSARTCCRDARDGDPPAVRPRSVRRLSREPARAPEAAHAPPRREARRAARASRRRGRVRIGDRDPARDTRASNTSSSSSRRWATCATRSSRCRRSSATSTATSSKPPRAPASTTLAGVYHACHRELCSHEARLAVRGRQFPRADRRKHGHPARGRTSSG